MLSFAESWSPGSPGLEPPVLPGFDCSLPLPLGVSLFVGLSVAPYLPCSPCDWSWLPPGFWFGFVVSCPLLSGCSAPPGEPPSPLECGPSSGVGCGSLPCVLDDWESPTLESPFGGSGSLTPGSPLSPLGSALSPTGPVLGRVAPCPKVGNEARVTILIEVRQLMKSLPTKSKETNRNRKYCNPSFHSVI